MLKSFRSFYRALAGTLPAAALFAAYGASAVAADELGDRDHTVIVVSPNSIPLPRESVGSSVTVIDSATAERRSSALVSDVLRGSPGLDLVRSGGYGGNTAVFIRGANSEHTLVLIDGVEANNPITPSRNFDLADLSLDMVDRIEILRGPQGILYGSDAIGGVINIISKPAQPGAHARFSSELGSYDTFIERGSFSFADEKLEIVLSASRTDVHGPSAASERYGNSEDDTYELNALAARLAYSVSPDFTLRAMTRLNDSERDLDGFGGAFGDDPNRRISNQELFARAEGQLKLAALEGSLLVYADYSEHLLDDNNFPDADHSLDLLLSDYDGELVKFGTRLVAFNESRITVIAGIEGEEERGSSSLISESSFGPFSAEFGPKSQRSEGYYVNSVITPMPGATLSAGVRIDDHRQSGSEVTWRLAPSYKIESSGTRLFGSVGTGFKAPSLYQLFSIYGSTDLQPEEVLGVDGGIEQALLGGDLVLSATYFRNEFDNLISFDPATFLFENILEATTSGVELGAEARPTEYLTLDASFTYLETNDGTTGEDLLRRPHARGRAGAAYSFSPSLSLHLDLLFAGARYDNDFNSFPPQRVSLGSYTVVNAGLNYHLTENVELAARLTNIFDREYEEVLGFGTQGAAGYGIIKITL